MRAVVVPQLSCCQSSDESGKAEKHQDTVYTEMTSGFFCFMDHISVMTVSLRSAFAMFMLHAVPAVLPVPYPVHTYSYRYRKNKQYCEEDQSLFRNHRHHHERLVSGRCNHHCYEGSEAEHPVRIK